MAVHYHSEGVLMDGKPFNYSISRYVTSPSQSLFFLLGYILTKSRKRLHDIERNIITFGHDARLMSVTNEEVEGTTPRDREKLTT